MITPKDHGSIMFKSEGHFKTFTLRDEVTPGGFWCISRIVILLSNPSSFTLWLFHRGCDVCWYLVESILSSICTPFPVPLAATQPQSMTGPPPGVLFRRRCSFCSPNTVFPRHVRLAQMFHWIHSKLVNIETWEHFDICTIISFFNVLLFLVHQL